MHVHAVYARPMLLFVENPYNKIDLRNIRPGETPEQRKAKAISFVKSEIFFIEVHFDFKLSFCTSEPIGYP
jgi:hypothetical protein